MPMVSGAFALIGLLVAALQTTPAVDLVVTERMHHLRSGDEREWAEVPERAEGKGAGARLSGARKSRRANLADTPSGSEAALAGAAERKGDSAARGSLFPNSPTAKPYQPTSIDFAAYVGVSGAVFVDADGTKKFESAFEYAQREISSANDKRPLATRRGAYDIAVATQAASLLRAQDPIGFEKRIRLMIQAAPSRRGS